MHHLGFTGTKEGLTPIQKQRLTEELDRLKSRGYLWMHNGDCIGADETAAEIWADLNQRLMLHPPINDKFRVQSPHYLCRHSLRTQGLSRAQSGYS